MHTAQTLFDTLNADYLAVHKTKEDLFWDTYMAISDDHAGFARAEGAYKDFISNPSRLAQVRAALASLQAAPDSADKAVLEQGLVGWLTLFECNIVDSDVCVFRVGSRVVCARHVQSPDRAGADDGSRPTGFRCRSRRTQARYLHSLYGAGGGRIADAFGDD